METEDITLTRDELLSLVVPAALSGPPGLAEKLLAYHRMARYDTIMLPADHFGTAELEFMLKARLAALSS